MRDKELGVRVEALEKTLNDITDTCTYCKKKVLKGKRYKTGEEYMDFMWNKHTHFACDDCVEEFQRKCKAAKIALANKNEGIKE